MDAVTATILITGAVILAVPFTILFVIQVIFSILRATNKTIFGLGTSLTIPALLFMLYQHQQMKKDEREDRRLSDGK